MIRNFFRSRDNKLAPSLSQSPETSQLSKPSHTNSPDTSSQNQSGKSSHVSPNSPSSFTSPPCPSPSSLPTTSHSSSRHHSTQSQQNISFLRIMLLITITIAGTVGGVLSYYFIRNYQYKLHEHDFENMVKDSYLSIQESLHVKLQMNMQGAIDFGLACPKLSDWPNCALPSEEFKDRTRSLAAISQNFQFSYFPIVRPESHHSFESFAMNYFYQDGGYPPFTGYTSSGPGIFSVDSEYNRYLSPNHTDSSRKYDLLVPIFHMSDPQSDYFFLLMDTYSDPVVGPAIDNVLDCVANISQTLDLSIRENVLLLQKQCSSVSDFIPIFWDKSAIGTPIFSSTDPSEVVGFTGALFTWDSVISAGSRVDSSFQCIVESSTGSGQLLFEVVDGVVKEKKRIDSNHQTFDHFDTRLKRSYVLNNYDLLATQTVYTITYYSTETVPSQFLATIACVGCIGVTLFISIIFEIFNFLIKREAHEANLLLDSKRTFVRFISHEIRTPLNTVSLSLRLLQENLEQLQSSKGVRRDESDRLVEECLGLITELDENSTIAVSTLNDLINYDKIETKTFSVERKVVDLWSVVKKTIGPLTLQAKEKGVKLKLTSQLSTPSEFLQTNLNLNTLCVIGDSVKLGQVIRNLVSNALKFTPPEGSVSIAVSFEPLGIPVVSPPRTYLPLNSSKFNSTADPMDQLGHILVQVTDTGPGLSPEQQKAMFREGVQFNPNELQAGQGSGLGLWISREIVSLHGGSISVRSDGLGKGSTFEVMIPAVTREVEDIATKTKDDNNNQLSTTNLPLQIPSDKGSEDPPSIRERHVLVVDDAASNRKLVCRILKSKGFICHEAENGSECVEKVLHGEHRYDFILLDFEMPIMDGPTAARKLRDQRCDIVIIGITGNVLPEDKAYFIRQGANTVLPKPVKIDELLLKLNELESRI